jgi:hypothetical protein
MRVHAGRLLCALLKDAEDACAAILRGERSARVFVVGQAGGALRLVVYGQRDLGVARAYRRPWRWSATVPRSAEICQVKLSSASTQLTPATRLTVFIWVHKVA